MEVLLAAPQLSESEGFYWNSYNILSTERPAAFAGLARIPHSAIVRWCERYGFTFNETEYFTKVMMEIDLAQVRLSNARAAK